MAFTHGKNSAFSIDNAAGTLTDIGTYCDSVSGLPGAKEFADVTAFGADGHSFIPGLENATFSVSGSFDDATLVTTVDAIRAKTATSTFEYGPAGSATGKPKYSGECWMTTFTIEGAVADKITWSAEFQVDGVVTLGTYA